MIPRFFQRVHAAVGAHLVVDPATLEARLGELTVGVECARADERQGQVLTELLVNQLARLYPRLCLFGDAAGVAAMSALARSINGNVELTNRPSDASLRVHQSSSDVSGHNELYCGAHGWSAWFGPSPVPPEQPAHPLAAAAAAALVAGLVFRRLVLKEGGPFHAGHLDLLRFGAEPATAVPTTASVDLGRFTIVGVGAVGSAAVWALSRVPGLHGRALVVEPETIELSNLQRYVLALDADVGAEKTTLATRAFSSTGIETESARSRIEDVPPSEAMERMLVSVDNVAGRRVVQALLPRLVVNGWTSASGLGASWHDFGEHQGCLACLYRRSGPAPSQTDLIATALGLPPQRTVVLWLGTERLNMADLDIIARHLRVERAELKPWLNKPLRDVYTQLICGAAPVPIGHNERRETVPLCHQSVLAGVLAAAELVKRSDPSLASHLPTENHAAWHDLSRGLPRTWLIRTARADGCICTDDDYRAVFQDKWLSRRSAS